CAKHDYGYYRGSLDVW
nr:immunoglobulin heavy chain junction region [Macaca mulatta]MOW32148.1 immunoglobulin heavy chain junction region [Macaca mulatta]MOW32161.1 immunoglobulin heavy chain junction region [Macaca mulatta]MOW32185.1 immunoglobulin heavy chain junction region [Macaca mulatta]MOW32206.1 immunoglobulin heavy chain junction region [Macaca mulatta]